MTLQTSSVCGNSGTDLSLSRMDVGVGGDIGAINLYWKFRIYLCHSNLSRTRNPHQVLDSLSLMLLFKDYFKEIYVYRQRHKFKPSSNNKGTVEGRQRIFLIPYFMGTITLTCISIHEYSKFENILSPFNILQTFVYLIGNKVHIGSKVHF